MSYIQWLRRQIGHQKTILVYSTVVLRDARGRILLQQRSDFAWWGLPGGILEHGEDIMSCARRELREETGLEAADWRLIGIYTHPRYDVVYPNGDEVQQFSVCFAGRVSGGSPRPDGEEVLGLEFVDPETLCEKQIPVWYRTMIEDSSSCAPLAFDPQLSTRANYGERDGAQSILWTQDGYVLPASMAVVQRADGKIYWPSNRDGQRTFPVAPLALGETAAGAAVRAAALAHEESLSVSRVIGVVSRPRWVGAMAPYTDHIVAAVFLLDAAADQGMPDEADWFAPAHVAAATGPERTALYAQILLALGGGYFVDEWWNPHV